ncbi:JAB domain-containing protein [Nitratifractor sp.]
MRKKYTFQELLEMVEEAAREHRPERIEKAADAYTLLYDYTKKDREHFLSIDLDGAGRPIEVRVVHIGTLTNSLVHPREVFRPAIANGAAGIIVAHNHPSGTLVPSRADRTVTDRLRQAADILGIELLDHLIITPHGFCSFAEEGLL